MTTIEVLTTTRCELVDITDQVQRIVRNSGVREGTVTLQSLHTTAGLTVNENADPDVARDMIEKFRRLVPHRERFYRHAEGNSDSHVKTTLFGPSLTLIVNEAQVVLGTWQGVYFAEWDGPRNRRVAVQLIGAR